VGLFVGSVYPSTGPYAGLCDVAVYGHGFKKGAAYTITFGGIQAQNVRAVTAMMLAATLGSPGTDDKTAAHLVDVVVSGGGFTATAYSAFTSDPSLPSGNFDSAINALAAGNVGVATQRAGYGSSYYRIDRDISKLQLVHLSSTSGYFSVLVAKDSIPSPRNRILEIPAVHPLVHYLGNNLAQAGSSSILIGVSNAWVALDNIPAIVQGARMILSVTGEGTNQVATNQVTGESTNLAGFQLKLFEPEIRTLSAGTDTASIAAGELIYWRVESPGPAVLKLNSNAPVKAYVSRDRIMPTPTHYAGAIVLIQYKVLSV
jgi:hypothetical protein